MAPPTTTTPTSVLVYAHTYTPILRLPLLLNNVVALPLCIVSFNIPGIVFICISITLALIDLFVWLRHNRCQKRRHRRNLQNATSGRGDDEEEASQEIHVSIVRVLADALLSTGLLIIWIIYLIFDLHHGWNYDPEGLIACFTIFLAWLNHTSTLLLQFYLWTWAAKKNTHACQHCGHRPSSILSANILASPPHQHHGMYTPPSHDDESDIAAPAYYNEHDDGDDLDAHEVAEDAALLKVDDDA